MSRAQVLTLLYKFLVILKAEGICHTKKKKKNPSSPLCALETPTQILGEETFSGNLIKDNHVTVAQ